MESNMVPNDEAKMEDGKHVLGSIDTGGEMTIEQMKEMLATMPEGEDKEKLKSKIETLEELEG